MDVYPVANAPELRAALISCAQLLGVSVVRDNGPPYQLFWLISQKVAFTRMDGNYSTTITTNRGNEVQISLAIWDAEPMLTVTVRTERDKATSVSKVFRRGGQVEEQKNLPRWFLGLNDPELQTLKEWAGGNACTRTARPSQLPGGLRSAQVS